MMVAPPPSPRTWPGQFLSDFEQTGPALWFYLYLLTWRDSKAGTVRGSFRRMAAKIGVSAVTLKQWLEQLEGEGYLKDESTNGKLVVKINL